MVTALRLTVTLAMGALLSACGGEGADPTRPPERARHLVLVSLDTLRADRLGCYGHDRATSPALDRFARGAVRFADARSAATNTTPSHMSMLTGVLPPVHGMYNVEIDASTAARPADLPPALPTLAERLADQGFVTAAFTDGAYLTADFDFDRGFASFDAMSESVDDKVDRVLAWLEQRAGSDERLFLFVHTYQVHAPYVPPREHDRWSDPAYAGPLRARVDALRDRELAGMEASRGFLPLPRDASAEDVRYLSDLYDGEVRFTDAEIGRLLEALSQPPWSQDTAVIVTADHGEAFLEHGKLSHTQLYEPVVRVPLLVRWPGVTPEVRADPTSGVDVTPTALALLGLAPPTPTSGHALVQPVAGDRMIMITNADPSRPRGGLSVVRGDTKLLRHGGAAPWQRFDLGMDPDEMTALEPDSEEARTAIATLLDLELEHGRLARELRAGWTPDDDAGLSPDVEESLRALGYVADDAADGSAAGDDR